MDFYFEACPNCVELMVWDSWDAVWACTNTECPVYTLSADQLADIKQKLEKQSDEKSQT